MNELARKYGWPKCRVCNKPVDEVVAFSEPWDITATVIIVKCHGEQEKVRFVMDLTNTTPEIRLDGWAFERSALVGYDVSDLKDRSALVAAYKELSRGLGRGGPENGV